MPSGTAQSETKASHHLIKNEHSAVLACFFAQSLQELRFTQNTAHVADNGLKYHRSNFTSMRSESLLNGFAIVVFEDQSILTGTRGDPR